MIDTKRVRYTGSSVIRVRYLHSAIFFFSEHSSLFFLAKSMSRSMVSETTAIEKVRFFAK